MRALLDAGVRVGLGVDGSASNERSDLFLEVKQALLVARGLGGPTALTSREALRLGTRGGAAVLGRDDIGELSPGKCADLAVWRTDGLELGGAADPVDGLVFSGPHRVDRLYVGGELVVDGGALVRADESEIARLHRVQARRFAGMTSLSTHVLDTSAGVPAVGVPVELHRGSQLVAAVRTDDDGRASLGDELEPGAYRLVFHPPSPFFTRVELEVELGDGHFHVPLLVSPYSCASYRGS